jgi:hypothetical protein
MTAVMDAPPPAADHRRMPWNQTTYPSSMNHLPPTVRAKAIEIANALLESGRPEGQSIRIGIAKAKEWAARHQAIPWRERWAEGAD